MIEVVIDDNFSVEVKTWTFPGGEVGVKLSERKGTSADVFVTGIVDASNIMHMLNILNALKHQGFYKEGVTLHLPYLPYARQDRVCSTGESFALEVFVKLLSTAYFGTLVVRDLHSNVSKTLLTESGINFIERKQDFQLAGDYASIVAPDKGAKAKAKEVADCYNTKLVCFEKTREDGKVVYTQELNDSLGCTAVVVDDICDGGATFIALAQFIKVAQPDTTIDLYVTHGIFSKGVDELLKYYGTIYTSNLMNNEVADKVTVI